jgi:glycerol-3-phosphate dehydrogenase
VRGKTRDPDAVLSRDARHLFLVPWGRQTLVGVWHVVYDGPPDRVALPLRDVQAFIDEINGSYPAARLSLDSVCLTQHGLVLFGENEPGATNMSYGKRSLLIDHERADGIARLLTLIGVRYTTARAEAARAVDGASRFFGRRIPASRTDSVPIHGGAVEDRARLREDAARSRPAHVDLATAERLVQNYGSAFREVIEDAAGDPDAFRPISGLDLTPAEVRHAVRREMARTLGDLILRRTDAGSGPDPGPEALGACARSMGRELGWDPVRIEREVGAVRSQFPHQRPGESS